MTLLAERKSRLGGRGGCGGRLQNVQNSDEEDNADTYPPFPRCVKSPYHLLRQCEADHVEYEIDHSRCYTELCDFEATPATGSQWIPVALVW